MRAWTVLVCMALAGAAAADPVEMHRALASEGHVAAGLYDGLSVRDSVCVYIDMSLDHTASASGRARVAVEGGLRLAPGMHEFMWQDGRQRLKPGRCMVYRSGGGDGYIYIDGVMHADSGVVIAERKRWHLWWNGSRWMGDSEQEVSGGVVWAGRRYRAIDNWWVPWEALGRDTLGPKLEEHARSHRARALAPNHVARMTPSSAQGRLVRLALCVNSDGDVVAVAPVGYVQWVPGDGSRWPIEVEKGDRDAARARVANWRFAPAQYGDLALPDVQYVDVPIN